MPPVPATTRADECEHTQYVTATGKCLNCPGYATIDGKPATAASDTPTVPEASSLPQSPTTKDALPVCPDDRRTHLVRAYREVYDLKTWAMTHGLGHLEQRFDALRSLLQDLANTEDIAGPLHDAIVVARLATSAVCERCTGVARFSIRIPFGTDAAVMLVCGDCLGRRLRTIRRVVAELTLRKQRGQSAEVTHYHLCELGVLPITYQQTHDPDADERYAWNRLRQAVAETAAVCR